MVALAGYEPANIFGIVTKQTYSVVVVVLTIMIVDSTMIMEPMISVNRDTAPRIPSGNEAAPFLIGEVLPAKHNVGKAIVVDDEDIGLAASLNIELASNEFAINPCLVKLQFVVICSTLKPRRDTPFTWCDEPWVRPSTSSFISDDGNYLAM